MMYNSFMLEEKFRNKIIAVIVLSVLILCGLLYIHFMPVPGDSPSASVEPTAVPTVVPESSAEAAVEETAAPEKTAESTDQPDETDSPCSQPCDTQEPTPEPTPEIKDDITTDDSLTRVVNRSLTIGADYVPSDLVAVNVHSAETKQLRKEAAQSLEEMFQAAIDDRIYLKLVDGYRSYYYQNDLYHYYVSNRGQTFADSIDSYPGASEHQLGLAADLGNWNGACELSYCFTQYSDYDWLVENSWKYGWIERYPDGKQNVTGIMYSPWHYRYVGKDAAMRIHDSGLTMEEYYSVPLQ